MKLADDIEKTDVGETPTRNQHGTQVMAQDNKRQKRRQLNRQKRKEKANLRREEGVRISIEAASIAYQARSVRKRKVEKPRRSWPFGRLILALAGIGFFVLLLLNADDVQRAVLLVLIGVVGVGFLLAMFGLPRVTDYPAHSWVGSSRWRNV